MAKRTPIAAIGNRADGGGHRFQGSPRGSRRRLGGSAVGGAAVLLVWLGAGCGWFGSGAPAGVAARVNGYNITTSELAQALALHTDGERLGPQAGLRLRLSLLAQLIDRELLLQDAAHLGITASPPEVDREMEAARIREPGVPEPELRQEVTDDLVVRALYAREVEAKIKVTPADIDAYYNTNASLFNVTETTYHLQEILLSARPAPRAASLAADAPATPAAVRQRLALIEARLKQGADFGSLAEQYSDDPNTAESGGDLGEITESALLTQVPAALRQAVLLLRPGQVSPPIVTPDGDYLIKLVDTERPGDHPRTDPQVRARIRDMLTADQEDALRVALLTVLRNRASVRNYLAERLLSGGHAPRLSP